MVLAINYSDKRFQKAQKFNSKKALEFGADKVIEWTRDKLPTEFKENNKELFSRPRGGGYWVWKPYIIRQALDEISEGDYVVYTDSGSAFVQPIKLLLDAMEAQNTDVMCFCIDKPELRWSKRDALIIMDCDKPEYLWSAQICTGYIILKKSKKTVDLIDEFLSYAQDIRIVSDDDNVMGIENYDEFKENRHDQTAWSLLCKKHNIKPFRDPSQFGLNKADFTDDVLARSTYPQVIDSHRKENIVSKYELSYNKKRWYCIVRFFIRAVKG